MPSRTNSLEFCNSQFFEVGYLFPKSALFSGILTYFRSPFMSKMEDREHFGQIPKLYKISSC
jgi:hypothetical protein